VPFLNGGESAEGSGDRGEGGGCAGAANCGSRVGLSASFCYGAFPGLGPLPAGGAGVGAFGIFGVSFWNSE